ncbi:ABC transporter ATP-binding protein [Dysosmobacter welbionis]|uniref:ABC transporter ATP-binding protein n=1 Tax=Dysosmobacter welbionis TaxID=2093857 RepID=UPI003A9233E1
MFQKVLRYTGRHRKTTYASILVLVAGVAMSVLPYFFLYRLLRPLLTGGSLTLEETLFNAGAMALCMVLYGFLYVEGLALSHRSAYHTLENLRLHLQSKLEKQPLGAIQEKGVGVWKKMFIDDIESMELLLAHALPEGLSNVAVPLFVFIAMFFADWKLALLSLCALPLGLIAMGAMYKAGTSKMGAYYASAQKMNNTIVEYINGMEVVKVFNRDGESYKRFEQDVRGYRDFTLAWYKVCWPWMALYNSILHCLALFTLPIGAYLVLSGASTLPDLALVLCMSFGAGAPLLRALSFMSTLPQINYKITALEQLMNAPALEQKEKPFTGKDHSLSFENVRFAYKEDEVLHRVSLTVPEGSLTALVGESGSGKSTLAKLLVHYYDVTGGSIQVGRQDLREMSVEALNDQISYVSQEQFLFNMSLLENIRLGKPDATDDEVLAAAEKAQCMEFLARLPQGIHTMAGDGGKQLSGGERQRISLARAILKDAPIVVLDEATAFMDPENEEKMNAAIAEIIKGKTVIVIAHRLHSIVNADQICVLNNGQVAGIGLHEKLLENCPEYAKLWQAAEGSAAWGVTANAALEGGIDND